MGAVGGKLPFGLDRRSQPSEQQVDRTGDGVQFGGERLCRKRRKIAAVFFPISSRNVCTGWRALRTTTMTAMMLAGMRMRTGNIKALPASMIASRRLAKASATCRK